MIVYGPVPSRRLGQSLGINNIDLKICPYSCVYCQIGRTLNLEVNRQAFYKPKRILEEVNKKIKEAKSKNEKIDYLAFVPNGEPTLDKNLGIEIGLLKSLGIKIAVITNASLLWKKEVRKNLYKADWVSVKIDSTNDNTWRRINRPHKFLKLSEILDGIEEFSKKYAGNLVTETMLIKSINDSVEEIEKTSSFIKKINSKKSYLSIPIRPPAEKWVETIDEKTLNTAYQIFKDKEIDAEYLIGYEGNKFAFTGNVQEDLLSITSVHPMRKDGVEKFLEKADANWEIVDELINEKKIIESDYKGKKFYIKRIRKKE